MSIGYRKMLKNIFKKIVIVAMLVSLSGCTTLYNPATGRNELILIDSATEVAIGQRLARELVKRGAISPDISLQERVRAIGNRIAAVSDRQDIEYKFSVLKDKELNALTLPGGFIYVNKGLMDALNDDELAYVLAHETGHVACRHIAKKIQSNMAYQLLLDIAFSGMGSKTASNAQDIARGVDTIYNLIELSYSRKDEYEADRLGVKYAFCAGFDPYAALSALEKIKEGEGLSWKILEYFRTHPYVDERINALKTFIPQLIAER